MCRLSFGTRSLDINRSGRKFSDAARNNFRFYNIESKKRSSIYPRRANRAVRRRLLQTSITHYLETPCSFGRLVCIVISSKIFFSQNLFQLSCIWHPIVLYLFEVTFLPFVVQFVLAVFCANVYIVAQTFEASCTCYAKFSIE